MNSTSESLLVRLRQVEDQQAWAQFVQIYTPLIFFWARKKGLQIQDARDVVQDVLAIEFQKLPEFQYKRGKSFRGWLRTITLNKHREHCRKKSLKVPDVTQSSLLNLAIANAESTWDLDYQKSVVTEALKIVQPEFQPATWGAVCEFVSSNQNANELAEKYGLSVWTVYSAKARLLERLRQVLDGIIE